MIVFVEGNEGTGKTTLINQLLEKTTIATVKSSKDFTGLFRLYIEFANSPQVYVMDRGFITDLVYRIWDKKQGHMSLYQIGNLCANSANVRVIMCHNFNGFENALKRGENVVTCQKDYDRIDQIFDDILSMIENFTDLDIYHYNYQYQSVDDVIKFIEGGKDAV